MPNDTVFRSVRMAPVYDAVTTVVFPNLERVRLALKLNGKDNRIRLTDFLKTAATIGLRASMVEIEIQTMLGLLRKGLDVNSLPSPIANDEMNAVIARMKEVSLQRVEES